MIDRPPSQRRAASITGASVLSTMIGACTCVAKRLATSVMSATPSRPTKSTQRSRTIAPPRICSRASWTMPSWSPASSISRKAREPDVLHRSPTIRKLFSWAIVTRW